MSDPFETIEFWATVEKVQTMAKDNTVRVWLDLSESDLYTMARLAEVNVRGLVLHINADPIRLQELEGDGEGDEEGDDYGL